MENLDDYERDEDFIPDSNRNRDALNYDRIKK